jgi:hypothetical protein
MVPHFTLPFRAGQVLEISFPPFTPRITFRSDRELTVEIVSGDNAGFSDTVAYEAVSNISAAPSCTCSILLSARRTPRNTGKRRIDAVEGPHRRQISAL